MKRKYGDQCATYAIAIKNSNWVIDAHMREHGPARYINHSNTPNAEFISRIYENGEPGVEVFAMKEILPDSELFVDYGEEYWKK